MITWEYNEQDYLNGGFKPITPGRYRVRIEKAEEATSKTSKQMIKLQLKVSGQLSSVFHYIVIDPEYRERTNKNLGDVFECFAITPGDFNLQHWEGKVGGADLKQEPYNDTMQTRVNFFIKRDKQTELPAWQEKASSSSQTTSISTPNSDNFGASLDDVPF